MAIQEIPMIRVHGLINSAILGAFEYDPKETDRKQYLDSRFYTLTELKVDPESIYCEEGTEMQDLVSLEHMEDKVRCDGCWLYFGEPGEYYFILQWYPDLEQAAAKVEQMKNEEGVVCFVVDITNTELTFNADRNG